MFRVSSLVQYFPPLSASERCKFCCIASRIGRREWTRTSLKRPAGRNPLTGVSCIFFPPPLVATRKYLGPASYLQTMTIRYKYCVTISAFQLLYFIYSWLLVKVKFA